VSDRPRLVIHGHFYQPSRIDPWTGASPPDRAAAPFHDWNARIDAECYRPNAERGNFEHISFDMGPTLASWLAAQDRDTYRRIIAADTGNAMAQGYHHSILPLASAADRRTEIRWGLRDFELRFGRRAEGFWLPETAVDLPTLRLLAEEGVRYTILAPWQAADERIDVHRPYRVDLGGRRSIVVVFYDADLSGLVSFDPSATADADRFAVEIVGPRLTETAPKPRASGPPLVMIATDGELYGHHQKFRELFLERLVRPDAAHEAERPFEIVGLDSIVGEDRRFGRAKILERTSWSCHHGVARWTAECPDAADGRWKGPLRSAFERLAAGIDAVTIGLIRDLPLSGDPDPNAFLADARDAYVDVLAGATTRDEYVDSRVRGSDRKAKATLGDILEAQRWRLAMFASDGWFWEDPARVETAQVLRSAARAVRLVDRAAGTHLEDRLLADLALVTSPSRHVDGARLYRDALAVIGQPGNAPMRVNL
jgi:hypothetical protein